MSLEELSHMARQLWVVWLGLIFVGIVAWAFWPRNKKKFEEQGNIPFRDDNGEA
jgi:cytochrome c oxidase cbb3-type subunit IV